MSGYLAFVARLQHKLICMFEARVLAVNLERLFHHNKPRVLGTKRNCLLLPKVCYKQVTNSKISTLQAAWIKAGIIKGLVRRAKRPTIMKTLELFLRTRYGHASRMM